jgi:hypothetical protein
MANTTEPTTPIAVDEPTTASTPAPRLHRGLALAGVIGGAVAVGALLFAGGIAVGVAIPDRGPVGFVQLGGPQGMPGGGEATRGDRQGAPQQLQLPGQRQRD